MDAPATLDQLFQRYEIIAHLSGNMLKAARQDDWDAVIALQQKYSAVVDTLRPVHGRFSFDASQQARQQALLRCILTDEAEVRERAAPRLAFLSALIASDRQTLALQKTYGVPLRG
ncbi:flagellar protein FliT [Trinickia mobilis]|uniref:flagellar protein FliT n=1 Tax=Trinickia mobilis TaxID=2816356 RepID=UPI001A8E11CE|nr:flagellar protein FliT [Trinickia mobilis]